MKNKIKKVIILPIVIIMVLIISQVTGILPSFIEQLTQTKKIELPKQTIQSDVLYSIAIKEDGSLWAWGYLWFLQDDTETKPKKIVDDVLFVSKAHLVIKNDNSLWTWGSNDYGQIGDGTTEDRDIPVKIMDDVTFALDAAGHNFAIKDDGNLWAWGDNDYGQLGDGTTENRYTPMKIMDDVTSIFADSRHTTVIKKDGSLWTWGDNEYGQLGDGTTENRYTPMKIMDDVIDISIGDWSTAAIKKDGSLWTWGTISGVNLVMVLLKINILQSR